MTRTIVALAAAAVGIVGLITPAYGADDVAELMKVGPRPRVGTIYRVELAAPDHLVGRRTAGASVDLRKRDGVWSGFFGGEVVIASGKSEPMGDGSVRVTLRSAQWGTQHQFVVRSTAAGDIELRGRGGWEGAHDTHLFLSADATTLTNGHCSGNAGLSSCLRFTSEDGRSYEGQRDGQQSAHSARFQLRTDGNLTPAATARDDPVLCVLLYLVGLSN